MRIVVGLGTRKEYRIVKVHKSFVLAGRTVCIVDNIIGEDKYVLSDYLTGYAMCGLRTKGPGPTWLDEIEKRFTQFISSGKMDGLSTINGEKFEEGVRLYHACKPKDKEVLNGFLFASQINEGI